MNRVFTYLCSALMLLALVSCGQKSEKLLLAGSGWNKIVIIDKETTQIEWEHPLEKGWEYRAVDLSFAIKKASSFCVAKTGLPSDPKNKKSPTKFVRELQYPDHP